MPVLFFIFLEHCKGSVDSHSGSSLYWEEALVGETQYQPCPSGSSGQVTRTCSNGTSPESGVWEQPDVTGCSNDELEDLFSKVNLANIRIKRIFLKIDENMKQHDGSVWHKCLKKKYVYTDCFFFTKKVFFFFTNLLFFFLQINHFFKKSVNN